MYHDLRLSKISWMQDTVQLHLCEGLRTTRLTQRVEGLWLGVGEGAGAGEGTGKGLEKDWGSNPCSFVSCIGRWILYHYHHRGSPYIMVALLVKNLSPNAGGARDAGSNPGSGRSPGVGNDNPLPCSCLGNPMDRGARWTTVHGVTESQTRLNDLSTVCYVCFTKIFYIKKKMPQAPRIREGEQLTLERFTSTCGSPSLLP